MEHYDIVKVTADKAYDIAARYAATAILEDAVVIRNKNLARLDSIVQAAQEEGDLSTAIRGIDVLNKLSGNYVEKVDMTVDEDIKFRFGDE